MGPLFDTSASALRFALNHRDNDAKPAAPIMNTMLYSASHKENAKAPPLMRRADAMSELSKLEKTLQAGIILNFLMTLPGEQSSTLIAAYRSPWAICNCTSICCSGFRKDPDWKAAIERLRDYLQERAETERLYGVQGTFKTAPPLMLRLLHKIFDSKSRLSQLDIAENCGVDPRTVAAHGRYIGRALDDWRKDGLMGMDYVLVHAGIVGAMS